jgi:hypothetical protein
MEDFLKKLYDTQIKLSLLLLEARDLAEEYNDQDLMNYLEQEINGYKIEKDFPSYRIIEGQIVADIKDVYGNMTHKQYALDFSRLSEKIEINLDTAYIPDGIGFIETTLGGITGDTALKPLPKQIVKMLDETFHYNNQESHLVSAYHRIPTPSIEYILVKVRQNLIQSFQKLHRKLQKPKSELFIQEPADNSVEHKKVFVSYAWEDEEHNSKVVSFVDFLRKRGFDASMDRKRSQEATSINFNQMMIEGIQNSEKVIVILSKKYKEKADKFEGGVWQELSLIIEDMKQNKNKYIFAYFGNEERGAVTPTAILGTDILDLKKDQDETQFNRLFSKVKEENIIEFSQISQLEIEIKKVEIKPFKL